MGYPPILAILRCRVGAHVPTRRRVIWDGSGYCSTCASCGRRIRRIARGKWRADRATEPQTEG